MRHGKSDKDGRSEVACGTVRDSQANSPPSQERCGTNGDKGADRHKLGRNPQGDRPVRVCRHRGAEAEAPWLQERRIAHAHEGAGEAGSEGHLRQAPRAAEDGFRPMDTGGGPHIHPRTLRHRDARAHGRRVPQTLGLHAAEADQGCLRAKAGSRERSGLQRSTLRFPRVQRRKKPRSTGRTRRR